MIQIKRVLFPSDFSDLSLQALIYARSFSEAYSAELHLVHVVDEAAMYWMAMGPNSLPVAPATDELVDVSKQELKKFVQEHLQDLKVPLVTEVCVGRPFMEIIRYARENEIDLIVIGTHGRSGLKHVLLGSVAEKVVRKAPCPVLTIRHPEHEFVMP
ncbi:MAG: universal stress protein [Phycisphaerales bacterium]|nr:universal stress protein [Phycisphaerales bacterium]